MPDPSELREHARTDLPGAQHDAETLPAWVFKPVSFGEGPAGLVLNLSDGGLQLLTSGTEPLDDARYEVVLLVGPANVEPQDDEQLHFSNAIVQRAWSRPAPRMGILHGMRIISSDSSSEAFLSEQQQALDNGMWVRCVLLKTEG